MTVRGVGAAKPFLTMFVPVITTSSGCPCSVLASCWGAASCRAEVFCASGVGACAKASGAMPAADSAKRAVGRRTLARKLNRRSALQMSEIIAFSCSFLVGYVGQGRDCPVGEESPRRPIPIPDISYILYLM